jgi:hypothetical protein
VRSSFPRQPCRYRSSTTTTPTCARRRRIRDRPADHVRQRPRGPYLRPGRVGHLHSRFVVAVESGRRDLAQELSPQARSIRHRRRSRPCSATIRSTSCFCSSYMDLTNGWELYVGLRQIASLPSVNVPAYFEADVRLAWRPLRIWSLHSWAEPRSRASRGGYAASGARDSAQLLFRRALELLTCGEHGRLPASSSRRSPSSRSVPAPRTSRWSTP